MASNLSMALAALLAGITLAVIGCGTTTEEPAANQPTAETPDTQADAEAEAEAAEAEEARATAEANAAACALAVDPFLASLQELDSRLSVGLNYDEYTNQVGNVQVVYDQLDVGGLTALPGCLNVAVAGEKAFNQYIKASNAWGTCFDDLYCSNDDVQPKLQRLWAKATSLVQRAQAKLDAIAVV